MPETSYPFAFPMPRTHTGVLLGNASFGAMVWGEANVLRITLGRADLWDHRGGFAWTEVQSFAAIRDCLERADAAGIRALFNTSASRAADQPDKPSVLPIGRFELAFAADVVLETAMLKLDTAELTIHLRQGEKQHQVQLFLDMHAPVLLVELPPALAAAVAVQPLPAWQFVGEHLQSIGFTPLQPVLNDHDCGWVQPLPADPALAVLCRRSQNLLLLTASCATADISALAAAEQQLGALAPAQRQQRSTLWWQQYWTKVPRLQLPNAKLQFLYDYGMYKFAGLTAPHGIAATLQGPWIEEYQMPPWSSDYHFNINVQMCYWPAFHGNCLEHLLPLFTLVQSWLPVMRHNAKAFLGIDDGIMLPHAVDDRCTCIGGFWTGTIDHGCTAWVAQMMYRYYRYSGDLQFLREQAYPFMHGAMRVYEEMLEYDADGELSLPVSVSPEYRGASMNAWGRNASFQLACIHRLCEDLLEAAAILGENPAPIWTTINTELPRACLINVNGRPQIALWEATPLEESHRHHSHLAGITPFDILADKLDASVIDDSIAHWIKMGMGLWSGWCVPWASMIHSRLGNADAAELWLEVWQRLFTNEGHGTLHDVAFPGFSLMGKGATCSASTKQEIMQIEAGMSCVAAIQEMLLHVRRGVNILFRGAPTHWQDVSFAGMKTDGGFMLSARRRHGRVEPVTVDSVLGGTLLLANPWPGATVMVSSQTGRQQAFTGDVLHIDTAPGESLLLQPN